MKENDELVKKVKEVISLYAEKMMASDIKNPVEELRSHSILTGGIGCYINPGDVTDEGKYSGGYAILKYADIEYNPETNELEIEYPEGQMPVGIDLMAWANEIEQKLNGILDINIVPQQENFYLNNQNTTKIKYVPDPLEKVRADVFAKILNDLLNRNEIIIKK